PPLPPSPTRKIFPTKQRRLLPPTGWMSKERRRPTHPEDCRYYTGKEDTPGGRLSRAVPRSTDGSGEPSYGRNFPAGVIPWTEVTINLTHPPQPHFSAPDPTGAVPLNRLSVAGSRQCPSASCGRLSASGSGRRNRGTASPG